MLAPLVIKLLIATLLLLLVGWVHDILTASTQDSLDWDGARRWARRRMSGRGLGAGAATITGVIKSSLTVRKLAAPGRARDANGARGPKISGKDAICARSGCRAFEVEGF